MSFAPPRQYFAKYADDDGRDSSLTYTGKLCERCGTTVKYKANRNCVKCKKKGGFHGYEARRK